MLTPEGYCSTCTRAPDAPYRSHDLRGNITEGCIDECHTGHVYGESAAWHNRAGAKKLRKDMKNRMKRVLSGGTR